MSWGTSSTPSTELQGARDIASFGCCWIPRKSVQDVPWDGFAAAAAAGECPHAEATSAAEVPRAQLPPHPGVTTSRMSPLLHLAEWEEPTPLQTGPLTQRTLLFLKGVIKFNCQLRSDNAGLAQPRPSPAAGSGSSAGTPPCPQSLIPQEAGAAALHAALLSASSQELKSDLF